MTLKKRSRKVSTDMELDEQACPKTYSTVQVRVKLKTYNIPVDAEGYVPTWAIVSRFHEMCDYRQRREDLADENEGDEITLPPRLRPEEIGSWWADPSSMDIEGIDTASSEFYDTSCIEDPEMAEIIGRIAVISSSKREADRIRVAIAEHFDYCQLDEATQGASFVIQTVPDAGPAYGVFMRKQKHIPTPIIIYENGASVKTIVHEMEHLMRTLGSRRGGPSGTEFPMTEDGELDEDAIERMDPQDFQRMIAVEEVKTEEAAMVRTDGSQQPSGYYDDVHTGNSPERMYKEDMQILKGNDVKRRVRNRKSVVKRIDLKDDPTNIALAEIVSRESAKVSQKKLYQGKKEKKS